MTTLNTTKLKQALGYAIQGAGFNKLLEMSDYMGIKISNDLHLILTTTDGTNDTEVSLLLDKAEPMDITVNAELFTKLINKITSDTITMEIENNTLVVTGNGKYTLALKPDENGDILSFPNKFPNTSEVIGVLTTDDLKIISQTIKPSLSSNVGSVYSSYYFGDVIASTDKAMLSMFNKKIFDNPILLQSRFVDLMCMCPTSVTVAKSEDILIASALSDDVYIRVCTKLEDKVNEYQIDILNKMISLEATSFCRIRKADILALLDRMALFVNKFDDGAIHIDFYENNLDIYSMDESGAESVDYLESKDAKDCMLKININRLIAQLKAYTSDTVDIYYGNQLCIKLVDGDITQVIALIK